MSGRRRQGLSPSLFPFLAVLVCTLGTLILLLALVAENAADTAQQSAQSQKLAEQPAAEEDEQSPLPKRPQLDAGVVASMIEEEQFRVEQLVAFRDRQTGDVEQRRDQLTHLEDHIARLRAQLKRLSDEVDRATGETPTNIIDQSAIAQLSQEIADQEIALADLREAAKDSTPRVIIVPHKGPNGTDRRPIYLECTERGVVIWPEGSQISTLQLSDAVASANPLDAALRAVRYHAMQVYGDTAPPYPLLVVRPDGIESYAAARSAMQDWDDQFGYELVPAEVKLAFTKPDPQLKQRIDLAIREAAVRQHARHAIARRSTRYARGLPTLSAASLDRNGRANGFQSHRDEFPSTDGSSRYQGGSSYTSGPGFSSPSSTGGSFDSRSESVRRLDDHLRTAAKELRTGGDGGADGTANDTAPGNSWQGSTALESIAGQSADGKTNTSSSVSGQGEIAQIGSTPLNSAPDPVAPLRTNPFSGEDNSAGQSLASGTDPGSSERTATDPSGAQASSETAQDGGQLRSGRSTPTHGDARQQASPRGANNGSTAPPVDSTNSRSQISATPSTNRDLVKRQGRDWALPEHIAGTRGNKIVRTIRIQCYEDRLVLLPPSTGGATEMFGFSDGEINRATLQLATAVRDRVDRWGAAIPGGRWQPRLDVEIMPQGETRFHQLRTLMSGSGVEVTGRASR